MRKTRTGIVGAKSWAGEVRAQVSAHAGRQIRWRLHWEAAWGTRVCGEYGTGLLEADTVVSTTPDVTRAPLLWKPLALRPALVFASTLGRQLNRFEKAQKWRLGGGSKCLMERLR